MPTSRHSEFIQPGKPEIGQIAGEILRSMEEGASDKGGLLAATLEYFWQSYEKTEVRGIITTGESIRTRQGNCFSLSCLVASALRRLGIPEHTVAVFIGCPNIHPDLVHAFVLTPGREAGYVTVVEPELMKAMEFSLQEFWTKYRVYVIFNDTMELTNNDAKRVWLTNLAAKSNSPSGETSAAQGQTLGGSTPQTSPDGQTKSAAGSPDMGVVAKAEPDRAASRRPLSTKGVHWIAYGALTPVCDDILRQLAKAGEGNGGFEVLETLDARSRAKIAAVPAAVTAQLADLASRAALGYLTIISEQLEEIRRLTECFRHDGKQVAWPDVAHIIVAGLLVDLAVREQLLATGIIHEQPDDFWIWGFEGGTGAANAFGVRFREAAPDDAAFHELWHCQTQRPRALKMDAPDIRLLRLLSEGHGKNVSDLSSSDQGRALKLALYGICSKQGRCYACNVPVLGGTSNRVVHWEMSRISRLLMSEAVVPAMNDAGKVYASEFPAAGADIFRHAFARLLMEHAMDRVVENKLVPSFPQQADFSWGCWLSWTNHD